MLNYRSARQATEFVTLTDVLTNQVDPELIRDRIIYIGYLTPQAGDDFYTPYSQAQTDDQKMPGVEIHAGYMDPCDDVGGDYYDVIASPQGNLKIGIGDVTGHGLESGLIMIMVQTTVRTLLESKETKPERFLSALNRSMYYNVQRINSDKTLTLNLLDYNQGTLYLSGQHEDVLVVRADGSLEQIDTVNLGFPIALEEDIDDFLFTITPID